MGRSQQTDKPSKEASILKKTPKVKEEGSSSHTSSKHKKSDKQVKKESSSDDSEKTKRKPIAKAYFGQQTITRTNLTRFLHHEKSYGQKFHIIPYTLFRSVVMRGLDKRDPYWGGLRRKIAQDTLTIRGDASLLLQAHTENFIPGIVKRVNGVRNCIRRSGGKTLRPEQIVAVIKNDPALRLYFPETIRKYEENLRKRRADAAAALAKAKREKA